MALLTIYFQAFALALGLIMAIGAQNAHVLRQGIAGHYVGVTVFCCALYDTVLMSLGVFGFGWLIETIPGLQLGALWGGAAFLFWYGSRCLKSALAPAAEISVESRVATNLRSAVLTVSAFTFLNPHVYLDTVVLVGAIGGQFEGIERAVFATGAFSASWVWFVVLGFGARLIRPWFENPRAWQILDFLIAGVMFVLGVGLVWQALG